MLVKFVEAYKVAQEYTSLREGRGSLRSVFLREIYINPGHVVYMREDNSLKGDLENSMLKEEIDPRQEFTRLHVNQGNVGMDIIVVGSLSSVEEKLHVSKKQVLKG